MQDLHIRELSPQLGAQVTGLAPDGPLDRETLDRLRALIADRGLLVFPGLRPEARFQTWLAESLVARGYPDYDEVLVDEMHQVSNFDKISAIPIGALMFHSDTMWEIEGCTGIALYGKVVAPGAIPTMFINTARAWETLPDDLRARVEGRHAIQCQDATDHRRSYVQDDVLVVDFEVKEQLRLPIAYPHPRSGRTLLYVSPQLTHHIDGLDYDESETLLEDLWAHMYAPENVYTHQWNEGDLIVWDNILLQHARPDLNVKGAPRTLRKTLVPSPLRDPALMTIKVKYSRVGDAAA
jgi:alpha-ketoglutarate-dependent taurine dioxygenase